MLRETKKKYRQIKLEPPEIFRNQHQDQTLISFDNSEQCGILFKKRK